MKKSISALAVGTGLVVLALARRNRSASRRRLLGKVVFITGSSRGLGLALAEEFGREGAHLVLTARDRRELEAARQKLASRGIPADGSNVLALACDLREPSQVQAMIEAANAHFGNIDVLVNNAGIITVGPVENQPLSAFTDAIESNYYSAVYTTMAVLPRMLARGEGSIVNIASIGGKVAVPHLLPYTGSKFALVGFSQGLHAELRSKGIRVTTVCPGLMRTGSHVHALFTGDRKKEYRWFSLGATLPGVAASVKSAAKKIVEAAAEGTAEIAITPQAVVISRLAQVSPGLTVQAAALVNELILPAAKQGGDNHPLPGRAARKQPAM